MGPTMVARLRVCASCEWVFAVKPTEDDPEGVGCPKCQFGSYGAHYVYGRAAYRLAKTQKRWVDKKLDAYASQLRIEARKG